MRHQLITLFIASTFISFDVKAVDLLQVYQEALSNDAQYASARAALKAGQRKLTQGRAGLLPSISLGGGYDQSRASSTDLHTRSHGSSYALSLTQPLFNWANWEQYETSKLAVASSEATFAQAQLDLITRVAQAYFDVLNAEDAVETSRSQLAAIAEQLSFAKEHLEAGNTIMTDVHEAQAKHDQARAQALSSDNELAIRRTTLQQIVGKPVGALAPLRPDVGMQAPQPREVERWVGSAEKQNYGVVGHKLSLEIARHQIKLNRAGHLPTVDLVVSRSNSSQSTGASRANSIGVNWNIPLFSGLGVTSRVEESIDLEEKARHDLEYARRTAAQAARQYYLSVNNNLAQIIALEAALVSSQSALEFNKLSYQIGTRINSNVLDAQQLVFLTRSNLAKARYDAILNGLRLKSAAGALTEDDLVQVNLLLKH